ncbi:hypothetical protein [Achromobacter xylosoxidans]|uniref:hypothetical protein n=1 Tax=Alcaligenes xylosoxydans xylosoxydans TaxID=85698 RepID=UPI0006C28AAD|nr:hypothetical protein [Achromobacter xylosoxidans]CUJ51954.1 Uncharacterised protein [Achromobacter xylosoxidans]
MTQQDDITQRLRDNADLDEAEHGNARVVQLERDAADEIERLRAELSKLRAPVADERAAFKKCHSAIIKALASIAMADGPDTRKEDDPELLYRSPVMDDVVRIRAALDECSAALASAPVADLRPHLEWALRRIRTSLDTGDKYEAAQAALDAAKGGPVASAPVSGELHNSDSRYAVKSSTCDAAPQASAVAGEAVCKTCGGSRVDPGGLPICRDCGPVAGEAQPEIEQMAVNRYRPVPDGKFSYKVVAGDGSRSLYTGTKDSCLRVAAKLTEAFLDGAFVASDAAPQASAENVRNGTASKRYSDIDFDGWIAMHCDCDDLTAYERKLARDAWDAAMASHQGEPVDLPRIDADRLRAIAASGSQTAMSNALLNVARALKTQADKDGGQQRAGDELTHLRAENQRLRNGVDQDIAEVDRLQALYDSEWRKCKKLRAAFDHPVFAFLLGEGQLHGVDFGERAPGAVGKWWWRKDLRAALSAPQAEQGERDA